MLNLAEILDREFANARQKEKKAEIGNLAQDEAKFLNLTSPYLSRLKNDKVPLTQQVIEKIVSAFKKYSDEGNLRNELSTLIKQPILSQSISIDNHLIEKYSIKTAEAFFDKELAKQRSLLCVDYRDLPQADKHGAFPDLAKNAGNAIKKGLCFAMFQPFGTVESLKEIRRKIDTDENQNHPNQEIVINSYTYLIELASKVRDVYKEMKKISTGGFGQVVLYEAEINKSLEKPILQSQLLGQIGLQSRLFMANYFDEKNQRIDRIFEWVSAYDKEHYFIERTQSSLSLDVLRLQFYPIYDFWEASERTELPEGDRLTAIYKDCKIGNLLGDSLVKWKDWSDPMQKK